MRGHRPDAVTPIAGLAKPRGPVNLDEALAGACDGVAGITPAQFRALLSPEDLRAYALSFAEGLRSARIGAPVHAREGAKPDPASGTITEAELDAARKGRARSE